MHGLRSLPIVWLAAGSLLLAGCGSARASAPAPASATAPAASAPAQASQAVTPPVPAGQPGQPAAAPESQPSSSLPAESQPARPPAASQPDGSQPAAQTASTAQSSALSQGGAATPPTPPAPKTAQVVMKNIAYDPGNLTVAVSTTVVWTNQDTVDHTVNSSPGDPVSFQSGELKPGMSFRFTFTRPGTYSYFCVPHSFAMRGTIIVQ